MKIYGPTSERKIPSQQGIYAFFINSITLEKIGLLGKGPFSEEVLLNAKNNLILKAGNMAELTKLNKLEGQLIESNKENTGIKLDLTGFEATTNSLLELITNCKLESLYSLVELISSTSLFNRPIYVGITKKQTLQRRYSQHKNDFMNNNDKESFGRRLRVLNFDWDDILFSCTPFPHSSSQIDVLNELEKYMMFMSKPFLSIK
jgi:hypothetical protein